MGVRRAWWLGLVCCLVAGCGAAAPETTGAPAGPPTAAATVSASVASASPPASSQPASSEPVRAPATTAPATTAPATPATPATTAPAPTLQSAFERVQSGVVRLEVAGCAGGGIGSGFQLGSGLVATAAHVVQDGQVVRVIQGTTSTAGLVVGIDAGADVALVRPVTPLRGHAFEWSGDSPRVGDAIAAIGFPEGNPLSYNTGTVNGLGRKAVIEGIARHDLVEIDAATTHGNSGGPVIRADGAVIGLVDAGPDGEPGRRLAVSSATAIPLIEEWTARPQQVQPPDCTTVVDDDGAPVTADRLPTLPRQQALATLGIYFRTVNGGDFPSAVAQLVHPPSLASFTAGVASSQNSDFAASVLSESADEIVVWVRFTSRQDPGKGPAGRPQETCTDWSLDYVLAPANGLWLIDRTRPHEGEPNRPCAAA